MEMLLTMMAAHQPARTKLVGTESGIIDKWKNAIMVVIHLIVSIVNLLVVMESLIVVNNVTLEIPVMALTAANAQITVLESQKVPIEQHWELVSESVSWGWSELLSAPLLLLQELVWPVL